MESLEERTLLAVAGFSPDESAVLTAPEACEFAPNPSFEVDGSTVTVGGTHGDDVITAYVGVNGLLTIHVNKKFLKC